MELITTWRTFRKEIVRRELTNQETTAINDSLKKFECEKANQFLSTGNEKGYKKAMMTGKRRIEVRRFYMKEMRDVQRKYLKYWSSILQNTNWPSRESGKGH